MRTNQLPIPRHFQPYQVFLSNYPLQDNYLQAQSTYSDLKTHSN
jgi:hypothetical protein